MKKRIGALIAVLILTTITCILAFVTGINPPIANVAGAYVSILAGVIIAVLFKVPDTMYYFILAFIYFAEPVGSVLNLYRSFGPYDKIVHFLSGVLIAAFGMMLIWKLFERNRVDYHQKSKLLGPSVLFAIAAAGAGAGVWEIIEFTIDIIVSGGMQRGMVDTITDMIAGNLGGLLYGLLIFWKYRKPKSELNI